MSVGPIQVMVFGFESTEKMHGQVLAALLNLRGRGIIRVVDLLFARKDAAGEVALMETTDLSEAEKAEFGTVIRGLIGLGAGSVQATAGAGIPEAAQSALGLSAANVRQIISEMAPGMAFGILMIEHTWAIPLQNALREVGGQLLAQGFVTPDSLLLVGKELEAMAEAKAVIKVAETVKSAAILDALMTVAAAEEVKTAVAADVLRTLILANILEEAAAQEAMAALAAADLIAIAALETAVQKASTEAGNEPPLAEGGK